MKDKLVMSAAIIMVLIIQGVYAKNMLLQNADSLIKVSGVVNDDEGNPISAKLFYEKLPYYDDMGIASAKEATGAYEVYMLLGTKYVIEVNSDGFDPIKQEITVTDDGNGQMQHNFELAPDFANRKIVIKDLNFARGRSVISTSSYTGLDEFANWLKARPNAIVQLEGHTDFQGNAAANMQLSQDRVDAVKLYLTKKGIKKNRVRTKAFGGTQPLTRDRTPEARAQNRRVEVQVVQQ